MPERAGSGFGLLLGDAPDMRIMGRPEPVPIELRRAWRVATILLILAASRGRRASREKILLLSYAVMNSVTQDSLANVLGGDESPFFLQVRVDPAVARAADFAVGLGLVRRVGGASLELTELGVKLANALAKDASLLSHEKGFLERVRQLATEKRVREVLRWR